MGLLGFVKDVVLLPIEVAADSVGLGTLKKIAIDEGEGGPFMTIDRLKSMAKNLQDTYDK